MKTQKSDDYKKSSCFAFSSKISFSMGTNQNEANCKSVNVITRTCPFRSLPLRLCSNKYTNACAVLQWHHKSSVQLLLGLTSVFNTCCLAVYTCTQWACKIVSRMDMGWINGFCACEWINGLMQLVSGSMNQMQPHPFPRLLTSRINYNLITYSINYSHIIVFTSNYLRLDINGKSSTLKKHQHQICCQLLPQPVGEHMFPVF